LAVGGATETVTEAEGGLGGGTVCEAEPQATKKIDKASGKKGLRKDIVRIVWRREGRLGNWTEGQNWCRGDENSGTLAVDRIGMPATTGWVLADGEPGVCEK